MQIETANIQPGHVQMSVSYDINLPETVLLHIIEGSHMGRSDKVSLWCVLLLINTRFPFFFASRGNARHYRGERFRACN